MAIDGDPLFVLEYETLWDGSGSRATRVDGRFLLWVRESIPWSCEPVL